MLRAHLEHILRAAAGITGATEFVIIGSQAILGEFPNAPTPLLASIDLDLYSPRGQAETDLIEGSIGEGSPFHRTFGYYAHGVGPETAVLPQGWNERLVPVHSAETGGATGLCLEAHDLAVSKLVAGRSKDLAFVRALIRYGLVSASIVEQRLESTPLEGADRELCSARLQRLGSTDCGP